MITPAAGKLPAEIAHIFLFVLSRPGEHIRMVPLSIIKSSLHTGRRQDNKEYQHKKRIILSGMQHVSHYRGTYHHSTDNIKASKEDGVKLPEQRVDSRPPVIVPPHPVLQFLCLRAVDPGKIHVQHLCLGNAGIKGINPLPAYLHPVPDGTGCKIQYQYAGQHRC